MDNEFRERIKINSICESIVYKQPMSEKECILLLSGGIDSTTCLAKLTDENYKVTVITYDYGQKNRFELDAAKYFAELYSVREHLQITLDFSAFAEYSSLTSNSTSEDGKYLNAEKRPFPATFVPGRNIIFLAYAAALADSRNIPAIVYCPNKDDFQNYPDCRKNFVDSLEISINRGTSFAENKQKLRILTPFIYYSKSQIVKLARDYNLEINKTQSCYKPNTEGDPCHKCEACLKREKALNIL